MALEIHVACMDPECKKCNPRWSPKSSTLTGLQRKKSLQQREIHRKKMDALEKVLLVEEQEGEPYKTAVRLLEVCKRLLKKDNINEQYKARLRETIGALQGLKVHW